MVLQNNYVISKIDDVQMAHNKAPSYKYNYCMIEMLPNSSVC